MAVLPLATSTAIKTTNEVMDFISLLYIVAILFSGYTFVMS